MDTDAFPEMRWTSYCTPATPAEALVLQVYEAADVANAQVQASRWRSIVPRSALAGLEVDLGTCRFAVAPIQDVVHREATRLGIGLPQIVMVGSGDAARCVLDLMLCNALADVHAVLTDLPSAGVVVGYPPARGALRFVQHRLVKDPEGRCFDQAIQAMRQAGLDIRTMTMPDVEAATDRAIDAFLVEMVAHASRSHPVQRSTAGASISPEKIA